MNKDAEPRRTALQAFPTRGEGEGREGVGEGRPPGLEKKAGSPRWKRGDEGRGRDRGLQMSLEHPH